VLRTVGRRRQKVGASLITPMIAVDMMLVDRSETLIDPLSENRRRTRRNDRRRLAAPPIS